MNSSISIQKFKLSFDAAKDHIKQVLNIEDEIQDEINLIELGLSSLDIMVITNILRKAGAKVTFSKLIAAPYLGQWWQLLDASSLSSAPAKKAEIVIDMHVPFELTDVQYAYWIGRFKGQYLGNVGCHGYIEFDGIGVDPDKLGRAWQQVIEHHPMLRSQFSGQGQQVLPVAKHGELVVHHLQELSSSELDSELESIRNRLSHRVLNVEDGQVTGLELALLPQGHTRIFFDIDLLVADVTSFQIILRDLAALYLREHAPKAPLNWNFAEYLHQEKAAKTKELETAKRYWSQKINTMPAAPALPLSKNPEQVDAPVFTRRERFIEPAQWEQLKKIAASYQVTPAMVLMALYGRIIHKWSENDQFLLNLTLFNRESQSGDIDNVVADFTELLLLEMAFDRPTAFLDEVKALQDQFHLNMEHKAYSAIQVQRDYLKQHPGTKSVAPVVFSYNVGIPLINEAFQASLGQMNYMISQTPQVWLDFQLYDLDKGLLLVWDAVDELFPQNLLDDMLDAYHQKLNWLTENAANWHQPISIRLDHQLEVRNRHIVINQAMPKQSIHASFFAHAEQYPNSLALIDAADSKQLTYHALSQNALAIAGYLIEQGVQPGECIAISLVRGRHQIEAILGVLAAGGVYVPVGVTQPSSRKEVIYNKSAIRRVIVQKNAMQNEPNTVTTIDIEAALATKPLSGPVLAQPEDSAYVIFTSGSTGEPKGVEIAHGAAMNTIEEINQKYQVNANDRVLTVSAIDFDLSVYDIFGLLGAGGALVLVDEQQRRDAAQWLKLIQTHQVSIWNSVPVLYDMLLLEVKGEAAVLRDLRLVCLSGDWIGLDLPTRSQQFIPQAKLIAMGGATEASIWSNYFEVELPLSEGWKSIPYGYPLTNQKYRIVDKSNEDSPDWVAGELWIGGDGVAKGYIGDLKQTEDRFVSYQQERWYRTGDFGRYWPDGVIEFLGRMDHQVKVRGHRIELGEIEVVLEQHPEIQQAIVVTLGEEKNRSLAAFVVPEQDSSQASPTAIFHSVEVTEKDRDTLVASLTDSANRFYARQNIDEQAVEQLHGYQETVDKLTRFYLCQMLVDIQAPSAMGDRYQLTAVFEQCSIAEKYHLLVSEWYSFLAKVGVVDEIDTGTYQNIQHFAEVEAVDQADPVLNQFMGQFAEQGTEILKDNTDPLTIMLSENGLSPNAFAQTVPGAEQTNQLCIELIHHGVAKFSENKERVNILELGARSLSVTKQILSQLDETKIAYTCSDSSHYFEKQVKEQLAGFAQVNYHSFNHNENPLFQQLSEQQYDVIVANNTLHRAHDLNKTLAYLQTLLSPGGLLILTEFTDNTAMQLIAPAFLEQGFSHFQDKRKRDAKPLLSTAEWTSYLNTAGFDFLPAFANQQPTTDSYQQHVIVATASLKKKQFQSQPLTAYLSEKLPEYMVPQTYFVLTELPITANGKINRKVLSAFDQVTDKRAQAVKKPQSELEISVAKTWQKMLQQSEISLSDSFYDLGGDSLLATQLIVEHKKVLNMDISLETLFRYPVLSDFVAALEDLKNSGHNQAILEDLPTVTIREADRFKPFPLTDIQQSYWIGRSGVYSLGDVSTHCYFEIECEVLDTTTLNVAWNKLIQTHPMMRAVILEDGLSQVVKESVPEYMINVYEVESSEQQQIDKHIKNVRDEMSHQTFDTAVWPLFDVRVSRCGESKMVVHISFDNIIFDGFSMFHLFGEWNRLYKNLDAPLPKLELTFRDYVLAVEEIRQSARYETDLEYWKARAATLPAAPILPLAKQPEELSKQAFTRFETRLSAEQWETFQSLVGKYQLTPSVVLMAAYAEVLGAYSKSQHFTLNLTRFARLDLHPQVSKLIGDFSSLTLLEVDNRSGNTFLARCQKLQAQLLKDLDHPYVSGVVVEREINKLSGHHADITMPIVFTSGIGVNKGSQDPVQYFGQIVYGVSQTPQVWIDHQVSEQEGGLTLSWDALCELFPAGMVEEMFESYHTMIHDIAFNETSWQKQGASLVNAAGQAIRDEANNTPYPQSSETLLSLFEKQCTSNGSRDAVISGQKVLTYDELNKRANAVAELLIQEGVTANTLVAVMMEKGWEQIVAVLAVLKANAAYMPVDVANPQQRIHHLLEKGQVQVVLTQSSGCIETPPHIKQIAVDQQSMTDKLSVPSQNRPTDLAYVIFTSGSTGKPKGVMIDHKGAVNTINDVNRRFNLTEQDRSIGLSNLNFDLSVFDIFGLLAVGGAIVLPDANKAKNPAHWVSLIKQHQVTVWNTVPMFMQMLVEHLKMDTDLEVMDTLRLALFSGDWIPLDLPNKVRELFNEVKIVGLGGATEASIWSNFFKIGYVEPNWKSIPYGKPLSNQRFYILNELMQDCPFWVAGDLYIGGDGVALGYWDEKEKTAASFIKHPRTHEKIYKTGDLGRYLPDGNIEFLGRSDYQVKVGGHRIELGEIEANIRQLHGIADAIVTLGKDKEKPYLVGHLVLDKDADAVFIETTGTDAKTDSTDFQRLSAAVKQKNQTLDEQLPLEEMLAFSEAVELLSTAAICHYLDALDLCKQGHQPYSLTDILANGQVTERFHTLIESWLERLVDKQILEKSNQGYQGLEKLTEVVSSLRKAGLAKPLNASQKKIDTLWLSLHSNQSLCVQLLKGQVEPIELLTTERGFLTPDKLGDFNTAQAYMIACVANAIEFIVEQSSGKTVNILELGTRAGRGTQAYVTAAGVDANYSYSDESPTFLERKQQEVGESRVEYTQFDFDLSPSEQGLASQQFDLIIADNALHRSKNLDKSLDNIKQLLSPKGVLLISEITNNSTLLLATVAFFEDGYKAIEDQRAENHLPLLSPEKWQSLLEKQDFSAFDYWPHQQASTGALGQHLMLAEAPRQLGKFNQKAFTDLLRNKIPDYMVPQSYVVHENFPLTINGKVDRNQLSLAEPEKPSVQPVAIIEAKNPIQLALSEIWATILGTTLPSITDNFFESGGDSLKAIQFVNTVKEKHQYQLALDDLFKGPSILEISTIIESRASLDQVQEEDDFETMTI